MKPIIDDVRAAKVAPGSVAIWWLGQAGYVMKTPSGVTLMIDIYLSGGAKRMMPPPIRPEDIECDLYICTHNHADHTDLESIAKIPKGQVKTYVGPKNVVSALKKLGVKEKIREVNVGDYVELQGLHLRGTFCIPTDDTVLDTEGFIITTEDGVSVYHSGDTGYHDFLYYLSKHPIDVMLACINGGMGNMDIDEAVKLARQLRPKLVIPNHYGMFAWNTADPVRFRTRLQATGADPACEILEVGEKFTYSA